jgi:hypothetical protein
MTVNWGVLENYVDRIGIVVVAVAVAVVVN